MLCLSANSNASRQAPNKVVRTFEKSDISIMYNVDNQSLLREYKVDNVTWGGKTGHQNQAAGGIKINSVNISLIQEGGKYVICGGRLDANCDELYWELRKSRGIRAQSLINPKNIQERAVLDLHGNVVGVPWLVKRGITIPMASVNDPGYKKWLIKKINSMLKDRPNAIHFDGAIMELAAIKTGKLFGLSEHSLPEFSRYLKRDGFDYKHFILTNPAAGSNATPPLWKEFTEFKLSSSVKLFGELVEYTKNRADWPLLVSANASPADWQAIPLIQYLDFIAPEVGHHASKLEVPSSPLFIYKMAEALNKPIVSTAFGTDWAVIKSGKHIMLASAWIAQAYAVGQSMNFPLKAWIPGSTYQPRTSIYPQLAGWIKEKSDLFDGYEAIAPHALIISTGALRSRGDRKALIAFTKKLMEEGVLFKIVLEQEEQKTKFSAARLQDYESLIIALPEYFAEDTMTRLQASHAKSAIWEASRAEMRMDLPRPGLVQTRILGETGVFCFPRKKALASHDAVVLHLLNRDYLPDSKRMKTKGPFNVKVSKKIFNRSKIKSAIFHQPILNEESAHASVNMSSNLTVKDDGEYLTITVPFLDLWGIVEFIYF